MPKTKGRKKNYNYGHEKKIILIFTIRHVTWDHNKFQRKIKHLCIQTNKKYICTNKQINKKEKKWRKININNNKFFRKIKNIDSISRCRVKDYTFPAIYDHNFKFQIEKGEKTSRIGLVACRFQDSLGRLSWEMVFLMRSMPRSGVL